MPRQPFAIQANPSRRGYEFTLQDMNILKQFYTDTIYTMGTARMKGIYREAYVSLGYSVSRSFGAACHYSSQLVKGYSANHRQHPFLLHIFLTVTLMHNRQLQPRPNKERDRAIAFHWMEGASLLNESLSNPVEPEQRDPLERDALWACAGVLGALSWSCIEGTSPEDIWPFQAMKAPSEMANGPDWLKMTGGKKAIWKIANPTRPDSVFAPVANDFMNYIEPNDFEYTERPLPYLSKEILEVCELDENSSTTANFNPYFIAAKILSQLVHVSPNDATIGIFMSFFGRMETQFRHLIELRDKGALLLLAYWFAKMCSHKQWWMEKRAPLQCQAICLYLVKEHGYDPRVRKAVDDIWWTSAITYAQEISP